MIIRSDKAAILRQMVRRFTEEEVIPKAQAIDQAGAFPWELFKMLGQMGLFGLRYPRDKGGAGGNFSLYAITCEELARGLVSLAAIYAMQVFGLLQHLAPMVVEASNKVLGLAEDGRAGGQGQGDGHLLGD